MSRRQRLLTQVIDRWIRRFGEPPVLRTDPRLMERILAEIEANDARALEKRDAA
jgi:hypothetical protein